MRIRKAHTRPIHDMASAHTSECTRPFAPPNGAHLAPPAVEAEIGVRPACIASSFRVRGARLQRGELVRRRTQFRHSASSLSLA